MCIRDRGERGDDGEKLSENRADGSILMPRCYGYAAIVRIARMGNGGAVYGWLGSAMRAVHDVHLPRRSLFSLLPA